MKKIDLFGHLMTAMVTPFTEQGEVDNRATEQLVEHLIRTGSDTLVIAGTTGESPTLSQEEKLRLFAHVGRINRGRVKLIANVGSHNTQESVDFVRSVSELDDIDGVMIVNPYYNKPSQAGLFAHFSEVARATPKPVMLYNIPGRTGVNLAVETAVALSEIPNIVALKESSGDLSQMAHIIEQVGSDLAVYSGDDHLTLPALAVGAKGVVSVASHLVGNDLKRMIRSYQEGDTLGASLIHRRLLGFFEGIFPSYAPNPVAIKTLLRHAGLSVGGFRLPLVPLTHDEEQRLLTTTVRYVEKIQ